MSPPSRSPAAVLVLSHTRSLLPSHSFLSSPAHPVFLQAEHLPEPSLGTCHGPVTKQVFRVSQENSTSLRWLCRGTPRWALVIPTSRMYAPHLTKGTSYFASRVSKSCVSSPRMSGWGSSVIRRTFTEGYLGPSKYLWAGFWDFADK